MRPTWAASSAATAASRTPSAASCASPAPTTAAGSSWRSWPTTDRVAAARVTGAKGLDGGLRVELLTDWPERLATGEEVFLEGEDRPRAILELQLGGRIPVLRLSGIDTREAAEELRGRYLEVPPRALPEGTYFWHQLEGLRVLDLHGRDLGRVAEVFRAGENEVYRIEGERELLVPALRSVVREIDLGAGTIVVDYRVEDV